MKHTHVGKLPDELHAKLECLFELARTGRAVQVDTGEPLIPWHNLEEMMYDLLDDVVDIWLDGYREQKSTEENK